MSNRAQRRQRRLNKNNSEPARRTPSTRHGSTISTGRWWAVATLIGPALPDRPHRINSTRDDVHEVWLRPMTGAEYAHTIRHRHGRPGIDGVRHGYVVDAPHIDVISRHIVRWVFDAVDERAAHDKAVDELVPELEGVLGLLDRDRYRLDLLRYGQVTVNGQGTSKGPWQHSPAFSMPPYTSLEVAHAAAISDNLRVVAADPVARHAVALLNAGDRANDFRLNEPSLTIAALNQFHLAVETVVRTVGGERHDESDRDTRDNGRAAIISALASALADTTDLNSSVRAVNRASTELRALNETSYRARATRTAKALALSAGAQDELLAFYDFRNQYIGHPGAVLDNTTAGRWAKRARDVACMSPAEWWGSRDAIRGGCQSPGSSSAVTAGSVSRVA